jgi:hypothetical protein
MNARFGVTDDAHALFEGVNHHHGVPLSFHDMVDVFVGPKQIVDDA